MLSYAPRRRRLSRISTSGGSTSTAPPWLRPAATAAAHRARPRRVPKRGDHVKQPPDCAAKQQRGNFDVSKTRSELHRQRALDICRVSST